MRIASSSTLVTTMAAVVPLSWVCSTGILIAAFLPPNAYRTRRTSLRLATGLRVSLTDQLSQLSYENAFGGRVSTTKMATSAVSPAATSSVPVAREAMESAMPTATGSSVDGSIANNYNADPFNILPSLNVPHDFDNVVESLASSVNSAKLQVDSLLHSISNTVQSYESIVDERLVTSPYFGTVWSTTKDQLGPILTTFTTSVLHPDLPPSISILIASYITFSVVSTILSFGQEPPPNTPYPMNKYDPVSARRYFDGKWNLVLTRALQVAFLSGTFLASLASDYITGKLQTNAEKRAEELSVLLTRLGPSFIKIGQSLSIRTDLLSPAYVRGLKSLQDQVPPFSTAEAKEIIESELGSPIDELFVNFPREPIAAASLGQVYRATIRGGRRGDEIERGGGGSEKKEVAVKVQRPNIMNQIALDMHLIREAAPFIKRTFNLNTDFVGVVDTWGIGFVDELDYIEEAINAKSFMEGIKSTPLSGVVFSPPVVDELTTRKVLTTEWVVGERLDKSAQSDVSILCSIAMNTYLTMMLETGVLHCDPHPGNLLRTAEGKLCILDWGMVTRLEPDLQLTLIEHMAHLTSADYEEIPKDLLLLGFIPESKADLIKDSGVVETLADIYGAWTKGGGAAAINVNK